MVSGGFDQAGHFVDRLPPVAQQHQHRADLFRHCLAAQNHPEGVAGFGAGQGAGFARAASEDAHVGGEIVGVGDRARRGDVGHFQALEPDGVNEKHDDDKGEDRGQELPKQ